MPNCQKSKHWGHFSKVKKLKIKNSEAQCNESQKLEILNFFSWKQKIIEKF